MLLTSGIRLARKWGNTTFELDLVENALRTGIELGDFSGVPIEKPVDSAMGIPEFSRMFSFSEVRW